MQTGTIQSQTPVGPHHVASKTTNATIPISAITLQGMERLRRYHTTIMIMVAATLLRTAVQAYLQEVQEKLYGRFPSETTCKAVLMGVYLRSIQMALAPGINNLTRYL